MSPLECQQYWESTLRTPRYADRKRLLCHGWKAYSQNEEDGILVEIFRRIGEGTRTFIEIGVGTGLENNSLTLLATGWQGTWIESDESNVQSIRSTFAHCLKTGQLHIKHEF